MSVQSKIVPEGAKTTNATLLAWAEEAARMLQPDAVRWCDGSKDEYQQLMKCWSMRDRDVAQPREAPELASCVRSDPSDVARVEDRTFICSEKKDDAGPTNNWIDPAEMKETLRKLYDGAHDRPHHVRHPLFAWARSVRPSPRSAWRSPTPPTSSPTCTS